MVKNINVLNKGYVNFVDSVGSDETIANIAGISYGKDKVGNTEKLIRILLKNGHMSPFEHASVTFKVKAPLFVARQWMRHRTGKYNEISMRYHEFSGDIYIPSLNRVNDDVQSFFKEYNETAIDSYKALISGGVSKEVARSVLPVGMYTTFYFTCDLRNLLHFLELRCDVHAQYEIREYALIIKDMLSELFPITMKNWE